MPAPILVKAALAWQLGAPHGRCLGEQWDAVQTIARKVPRAERPSALIFVTHGAPPSLITKADYTASNLPRTVTRELQAFLDAVALPTMESEMRVAIALGTVRLITIGVRE